ncbi:hypothetical protein LJC55_04330, partial [Eubacteriales bacterium OttesenSCG-928-N14]|nr:hypothetical protein [Eubacteriales bacterium OttesenSCG-928-N14]
IFSKNEEYGYSHLADLSAGLDSRMVNFVAHDLGYKNVLNICYSQSGSIDARVSKKISKSLGNTWHFSPIDGGFFLKDIDDVVGKYGGQEVYCISTGANRALNQVDTTSVGLCVSGVLGEVLNAYWTEDGFEHTPVRLTDNRYSHVVEYVCPEEYYTGYDNFDHFNNCIYSLLLFHSSLIVRQDRCEPFSPMADKEYMEFCMRLPLEYRKNYRILLAWMKEKYPSATNYVWLNTLKPIKGGFYLPYYYYKAKNMSSKIWNKLFANKKKPYIQQMNPFDIWYQNNEDLRNFMNNNFSERIGLVEDSTLKREVSQTFEQGKCVDKICALNVLAVYNRYFK